MREAIHGEFQGKTHTHPYQDQDREAQISFFPFNNNNKNFPNFLFSLIWLVRVLEL